ncbi:hypothetical protein [Rugosimonospora africana]|uniref:Uncharacterized protein n=1 Tax=Rugosimonospora africana TaxID=556532 RepID=A0A8J3VMW7_9ACTN|nr:hypothetical protein [Rugosimonospora africana]GIH12147.1 hypothetical protein Raf01_03190 [Rugosimonospora africana]
MKPHRTDVISLIFGLIFVLIASWWALGRTVHVGLGTLAWATAVALILLGGLGLLGALRGRDRARDQDRDEWPAG